jgi:DNA-directed RNA polymerase subunit RPC12/RpoP
MTDKQPLAQQASKDKLRRYNCAACGAQLLFQPRDGLLACSYCQNQERIPASSEDVQERSYERYLSARTDQIRQLAENVLQVDCSRCGALVVFTPPEVARTCSFCGEAIVMQPRSADPMVCPEAVLPFAIEKQQAKDNVRKWTKSRWFAPNALKFLADTGAISGVYIPFWTYDAFTRSFYTGERGEHYYETEEYTEEDDKGNKLTKTRQVQKTRWYLSTGTVEHWFDDILVPATRSLSAKRLKQLEPWDLPELKPYDPAFLSGFQAQRYQLELADGFAEAKKFAAGEIDRLVRKDIGGDDQRVGNIQSHYSAVTFKHILMPVYVGAYIFKKKTYQVMVNGRTGEVQGERPYSTGKIVSLVLLILLALLVLIALR